MATPATRSTPPGEHLLPLILSFAAGYVEAICFVGLYRTFTTFITGTLMILIIELVNGEAGWINKAVVFGSFALFTLMWIWIIRTWRWPVRLRKPVILLVEAILIGVFTLIACRLAPLESAASTGTLIVSVVAVLAMSLHSTVYFVLLRGQAPTHFMTGNLTSFGVGLVDLLRAGRGPDPDAPEDARFKVWHYPTVIVSFAAGCVLGSAGYMEWGFVVLVVPAIAMAAAAGLSLRIESRADG